MARLAGECCSFFLAVKLREDRELVKQHRHWDTQAASNSEITPDSVAILGEHLGYTVNT